MNTIQYLNKINKRFDVSDYKASGLLGITRSAVSRYRNKQSTFDESTSIKVAELLDIPEEQVLVDMQIERAKTRKTKEVWQGIAKALRTTAATAIIALVITNVPVNSNTYESANSSPYILC